MGIDPLTEEQFTKLENSEIKMYSFQEWQYFKSILFQTFYFKDVKDLIVNLKNKLVKQNDVVFKFEQKVNEKIYIYDQTNPNHIEESSIFKYDKDNNKVTYPEKEDFELRLKAIVDNKLVEANTEKWNSLRNVKWTSIEQCYFLPIALMWAVNNYFNTYNLTEENEEQNK